MQWSPRVRSYSWMPKSTRVVIPFVDMGRVTIYGAVRIATSGPSGSPFSCRIGKSPL